jgi:hypothetical protein
MIRDKEVFDLYTDYLICSTQETTATGLSLVTDNKISHDRVTRFLRNNEFSEKDLWTHVKNFVREIEEEGGTLILDDSIEEKPHTDENNLITWHFDHTKGRNVKGINFITALYSGKNASVPISYKHVIKSEEVVDKKTGKKKKKSPVSKQEHYRNLLLEAVENDVKFKYVLNDAWFSSSENMNYIKKDLKKEFIMPIKNNRLIALSEYDKDQNNFVSIDFVKPGEHAVVWLRGVHFPVLLCRLVFKDEDDVTCTLDLVSSDLKLTVEQVIEIYKKRWNIEIYHKVLKSNASLASSPTKTEKTQKNHFFCSLCAYIKLEKLSRSTKLNPFALRHKIYISALKKAFIELQKISQTAFPNFIDA